MNVCASSNSSIETMPTLSLDWVFTNRIYDKYQHLIHTSWYTCSHNSHFSSYFSTKAYVLGTQSNAVLSTQSNVKNNGTRALRLKLERRQRSRIDTTKYHARHGYHTIKWQNTNIRSFPAGDHKAAMNRCESITITRYILLKIIKGPRF